MSNVKNTLVCINHRIHIDTSEENMGEPEGIVTESIQNETQRAKRPRKT